MIFVNFCKFVQILSMKKIFAPIIAAYRTAKKAFNEYGNHKDEINIGLALDFLIGTYRYEVYYMNPWWLRDCIVDQFEARMASMNPKCYSDGQCVMCGCQTTALQMANKSCNAPCYPPLMGAKEWEAFKENGGGEINGVKWKYFTKSHTFITKK